MKEFDSGCCALCQKGRRVARLLKSLLEMASVDGVLHRLKSSVAQMHVFLTARRAGCMARCANGISIYSLTIFRS
ncbi:hypothetical protein A2U01_0071738, partial [Trifolium medium]|nr:hypothetical protein [Trifolium medium]